MLNRETKRKWFKKNKKNGRFKKKLKRLRGPRTDEPRDAYTDEQAKWQIFCNVYFTGD